ncbi:AAA family ATPase [Microcoleus sp. herbarium8]|uniref:ExeA family protein n=1 Tax=Microcoleus sp. herbarium8 TaxID=3055436 RepID=UPI002FD475AC
MIRSYFGISHSPFSIDENQALLEHQQRHFDILKVHSQQGGLCVILGEPGTGKSVLKNALIHHNPKQWITPVINRSLHSWHNLLRLLCHAMQVDADGTDHKCEARLITEARNLNNRGKLVIPIIDDAHLLPPDALHKLRLLLEDFPKNHNLILLGQPQLNTTLQLRHHADFKNRITYSARIDTLAPAALADFIHGQLDRAGLAHSTFTEDATALIIRASEGALRAVKNLCVSALLEAVRDRTKIVDLKQINAVLMQPHWRHNSRDEPAQPVVTSNQKTRQPG